MQVLISPVSLEEAASIIEAKADIIDIKNVNEGSLGAQFPWNIVEIVDYIHGNGVTASATLGDLPYKPGTAALAAYGVAHCGVNYIKAGLHGLNTYAQAVEMMDAIRRAIRMVSADAKVVASGYADYRRFNGLNTWDLVRAAKAAQCDVVMVDTAIKDGKTLFDVLTLDEINDFVGMAKAANLKVALAGSIKAEHAEELLKIDPDIIGVRGAVCGGTDRYSKISVEKTKAFLSLFRKDALEAKEAEKVPT
ncbi:MAG: (5-formylfuran-3-yl)methyl phosphate synthase [Candidatus Entotheonellia bacterium]